MTYTVIDRFLHEVLRFLEMHLEAMREDGEPIPEPTTLAGTIAIPA